MRAYESLAAIDQAAEQIGQHIERLKADGLLKAEPAGIRKLAIEQLRAEISVSVVLNLADRENEIAARTERERLARERKLNS